MKHIGLLFLLTALTPSSFYSNTLYIEICRSFDLSEGCHTVEGSVEMTSKQIQRHVMNKTKLWMAHATADADEAKKLEDSLDQRLFDVLNAYVEHETAKGNSIRDVVKQFIHQADVVVALLSQGMEQSEVISQLREAVAGSKPLTGAFVSKREAASRELRGTEIASLLWNCPHADLSESDGLSKLVDTIRTLLAPSANATEPPFEAYDGSDPYIFVSYSHKDSDLVYREIDRLHQLGFRIWYDEGIDPGNEWPEEVATALNGCASFLVFITPRSVESQNVRNEISFAINRKKPFLAVHVNETTLPKGLELRMGDIQAIFMYRTKADRYTVARWKNTAHQSAGGPCWAEDIPSSSSLRGRTSCRPM